VVRHIQKGEVYVSHRRGEPAPLCLVFSPCGQTQLTSLKNELERLDVFHKVFLVARKDALHSAPLSNPESPRILDLGCGTGIWGIDMGR
jgi:hypothetical protein